MTDNKKTITNAMLSFAAIMTAFGAVILVQSFFDKEDTLVNSGFRDVMGTFAQVSVVMGDGRNGSEAGEAAFDQLTEVDASMSDYIEDSELSQLNRNGYDGPVKVSDGLFEVISAAVQYSRQSDGAFDITIGPLVGLWREAERTGAKPTEVQVAAAKAKVGYEKLQLDAENRTVKFTVEGMLLDLGGIAKGYAIDKAIEAARAHGAKGVMVDVGGDIMCFGNSLNGQWKIGLQDPTDEGEMLLVLKLCDVAVATSGDYRRFVVIGDERFNHIFSPKAGVSAGELTSVSVIAGTAMQADALATAVSVMGVKKGMAMIDRIEGVECMVIQAGAKGEIVHTKDTLRYIDSSAIEQMQNFNMIEFKNTERINE